MTLPKMDETLALVEILKRELPVDATIQGSVRSSDDERRLRDVQDRLLAELAITHDERTREAILTNDLSFIESLIKADKKRSDLAMVGVAGLVYTIVSKKLFKDLYLCRSQEEYFSRAAPRLKLKATTLHNLYVQGLVIEENAFLLMNGYAGVPGVDIQFIAANRTKLLDFTEALSKNDPREVLAHYREDNVREFARWAKYGAPAEAAGSGSSSAEDRAATDAEKAKARKAKAQAKADAKRRKIQERQARIDAEVARMSEDELTVIRIYQSGNVPYIVMPPKGRAFFLNTIEERLEAYREGQSRDLAARLQHEDFDPEDPVNLGDGLGRLSNIYDIEERIMEAMSSQAEGKRLTCVLLYRVYNERPLVEQWTGLGYRSFQSYAEDHLGLGSEVYDLAKVGHALLKYRYLIADLADNESDNFFKKLVHLDAAIQTYRGDIVIIRQALDTLDPEDFADFAKNSDFKVRQLDRSVTAELIERAHEFFAMMNHYRHYGHVEAMKLVSLMERDESRIVHRIFREMEAELAAGTLSVPADPSEAPTSEVVAEVREAKDPNLVMV